MYLKKVTITGFKSFATRTVLDLEQGITAIVGPNGSGKSNIADAVRWALGEQSKGRLRLGDREEVVFGGTDRRARASFAEVVLLFDNQDGAFGLDLTEVEISRRLYRSGEADYRLGGRSVRLGDIQALLAEAGFGTGSYAVIGQGTIESFLLSSPAERKLLFDEAAGIRGAELKREASLRKLSATAANLTRLRDIAGELAPRLASLQKSVAAADELRQLETQLAQTRRDYAGTAAARLEAEMARAISERDQLTTRLHRVRHELRAAEGVQSKRLRQAKAGEDGRARRHDEVARLEAEREAALVKLTEVRARQGHLAERLERRSALKRNLTDLERELATEERQLHELEGELSDNNAAAARAARVLERAGGEVAKAQAELVALRQETADGTQQQYVGHALQLVKTIARSLGDDGVSLEELRLMIHKTGRLLSHASKRGEEEVLTKLRQAQTHLESAMIKRETATEHQTNITITRRSLEIDIAHHEEAVRQQRTRVTELNQRLAEFEAYKAEAETLRGQLKQVEHKADQLKDALESTRRQLETDRGDGNRAEDVAREAARLEHLRSEAGAAELAQASLAAHLTELRHQERALRTKLQQWGISGQVQAVAADPSELEYTIGRLEAEVAARQAVQQDAVAEYEEVGQRQTELITQIADLEQAELDLRQVVTQLDGLIRERFKTNFASLAEHFSQYFVRLFGGGSAGLELEEAEDGSYGIQIKASPKGKRVTNLTSLSGGERALAGVALLAAILSVNPSPFVVLDEIDAALDEANSGRLADILDELSDRSQLLVITHNRQTMRSARVLFGVTMNEHHVSRLLSLHLEEATKLAAR